MFRFYTLLKEAEAGFAQVVREQGEAEAADAELPAIQNPKKLPQLHVIKQTLVPRLNLPMENLDQLGNLPGPAREGELSPRQRRLGEDPI